MKHLFKKGLSLFLAVLMVVSMLPVDALAVAFVSSDEDAPARREEPVLDVGDPIAATQADSISRDERRESPEVPDTGDEGDLPVDPFWANVTLTAVLKDATTGEIEITGTLPDGDKSSAGLENAAVVLAPIWGNTTLSQLKADNEIKPNTSATWLETNLPGNDGFIGLDRDLFYICDVSTEGLVNGVWKHTATLGMSYAEYIEKANDPNASETGGIKMEVMLCSLGSKGDVCIAPVTIQPKEAILKIDGAAPDVDAGNGIDTIFLPSDATSFQFDIKHTEASTETAIIRSITWQGPDIGTTNATALGAQIGNLANPGSKTITANLPYSADEGAGMETPPPPWIGDVVIGYNDAENSSFRYLRVHVRPFPTVVADPIRITVIRGGDPVSGGPVIGEGGTPFVILADDAINGGASVTDGSTAATSDNEKITLELDSTFTGGYQMNSLYRDEEGNIKPTPNGLFKTVYGYYNEEGTLVEGENPDAEAGSDIYPLTTEDGAMIPVDGFSWPAEGTALGNVVTAQAAADAALGTYTVGSVHMYLWDSNGSAGYVDIPVILTVEDPKSYQAIFHTGEGDWGDDVVGPTDSKTWIKETLTEKGQPVKAPTDPTRPNYKFDGWSTSGGENNAAGKTTDFRYSESATRANHYYAIWVADKITYTLKFDANTSETVTGMPDPNPATAEEEASAESHTFTLDFTTTPQRAGYEFAGWASSPKGSAEYYDADGKRDVPVPKGTATPPKPAKTIYAVWTPLYGVTYADATDAGGHTYPKLNTKLPTASGKVYKQNDSATVTYAEGYAVNATVANGDGLVYKFTGWTRSDTGAVITATSLTMPGEDLTLTATWAPVTLNVTYDLDGGTQGTPPTTDSSVPKTVQKGGTYTILAGDPTKENYDFLGWSTGTTGGQSTAVTNLKVNGTVSDVTADLTLTAEWERHQSTVTFLLDGGALSGFTDGKLVRTGPTGTAMDADDFPSGTPTKAGYTFKGWKNGSTEYDADNLPTYPADKGGNLNITATWTRDESFIVFDLAGGNIDGSTDAVREKGPTGDTLATNKFPANPTKDGFTFKGWSDGYTATGDTPKLPKFPSEDGKELTITAQWEAKGNAVRYLWNYTGAPSEGVYASESVKTNESPKGVADPERTGYDFGGWYKKATCLDADKVADVTALTITAAVDLYAKWTPKKVTVNYVAVHGNDPTPADTVAFGTEDHTLRDATNATTGITGGTWSKVGGKDIFTVIESDVQHVYRFDGWTRDDTNVVTKIDIDEEGPIEVTATWTELFTVTYADATGAPATIPDGATKTFTVDSGDTHTLFNADGSVASAPTMANGTGYTFVGWKAGTDDFDLGTADYTATGTKSFTVNSNVTLYPVWKINQYTVTFMQNHDSSDSVVVATKKTNYNTALGSGNFADDPSWAGYTFGGWYPNADGSGTEFTDATLVTADISVYAKWKANVTYAWGDVTPAGVTKPTQEPVALGGSFKVADTPNKTDIYLDASGKGYTFDGWSMVMGADAAVDQDPEAEITNVTAPVTLTGQWTAKTYPVTYIWGTGDKAEMKNTDGDKVDVPTQSNVQHGDKFNAANNAVTPNIYLDKAGKSWKLIGWSVKMGTADAVDKALGAEITNVTAAVTLTARWEEVTYTVTYDYNYKKADGSAAGTFTTQTDLSYGAKTTAPDPAPTRDNYQFAGWYKQTGCTTAVDFANDTITQDTTYYAKWTGQSKVEFDLNGGVLADTLTDAEKAFLGEQTGVTGTKDTLKKPGAAITATTLTRVGYSFQGWSTDNTATSATAAVNLDNVAFPDNAGDKVTYYAIWKINEYDITYVWGDHAPDGKNAPSDKVNHGDKHTVSNIVAVDTVYEETKSDETLGWIFKGWVVGSGDSAVTYKAGDEITNITAPVTLTAKWEAKMVTVTLDRNGHGPATYGDPWSSDNKQTVQYGKTVALPDPTDTSYSFVNWTGTGGPYAGGDTTAALKKDETFTANWQQGQSKIKFVANNGAWTGSTDTAKTIQGNAGEAIPASGANAYPGTPARIGYTFAGWLSDETTPVTYPANGLPNFPAAKDTTLTLTAQWTANKYKVTYDPGLAGTNVGAYIDLDDTTEGNQTEDAFTYDAATLKAKTADVVKWANAGDDTGWHFQNWLSDTTDGSKPYVAGAELGTNAKDYNFTLTAQWKIDVSYDANWPETDPAGQGGVSVPSTPAQIDPSGKLTTAQTAKPGDLTNWTFDGWYTTPNDTTETGVKVDTDTEFDKPATIYARWEPNLYDITYVDNDEVAGDPTPDTDQPYNSEVTLPSAGTKTGYVTTGWYDADQNATGANKVGDAGDKYTVKGDATLYAHWTPVKVTVSYLTDHGTKPADDSSKDYDSVDYTVAGRTDITAATGDTGWHATENIYTDKDGNRWRFDHWEILDEDSAASGKTVASAGTVAKLNLTNGVVEKTTEAGKTYTLTLKAHWTQLFTVTYDANEHGGISTQPTGLKDVPAQNNVTVQTQTVIDQGGHWDSTRFIQDGDGTYWAITGWNTAADGTGTPVKLGGKMDLSADVTLYAQWQQQYKVILGAPGKAGTADAPASTTAKFAPGSEPAKSLSSTGYVWVNAGDAVTMTELATPAGYVFDHWTSSNDGTFANSGTAANGDDVFTPKEGSVDVTLTPYYYKTPTLTPAIDSFHLNFAVGHNIGATNPVWGSDATHKKDDNTLPTYTWTKYDATPAADDGEFQVKLATGWTTLKVGTDTTDPTVQVKRTVADGVYTYQFTEAYLKTLTVPVDQDKTAQIYDVRVVSALPNTSKTDTTLPSKVEVVVTPDPLEEVIIQVKDETSATANVDGADDNRDGVKYKDHTPKTITAGNLLTYTWYVSTNEKDIPTQQAYTAYTKLSENGKNADAAKADANKYGTAISGAPTGPDLPVNKDAYKGKWIYAVVAASNTGYGAVITNSIAVDYDAVINVTKDGSANIDGSKYTVFLVEATAAGANTHYAAKPAGAVDAVWQGTAENPSNQFKTVDSALTGGKQYKVFANKVEGNSDVFVDTGIVISTQTAAGDNKTVEFFSVNKEATTKKDAFDHSDTPQNVGEKFGDGAPALPDIGFATVNDANTSSSITVGNTLGVLKGSKVTATTDNQDWTQDYNVDWGVTTTQPSETNKLAYTTVENQTKAEANTQGTGQQTIEKKTWMGARLEQNTYTVTGNVWNDSGATQAGITAAKLTYTNDGNTYTFKNTAFAGGSARHKNPVTFAGVPRSNGVTGSAVTGGKYVIEATPATNPKTTILAYREGIDVTAAGVDNTAVQAQNELTDEKLPEITGDTTAATPAFTIELDASTYKLELYEDNVKKAENSNQGVADEPAPADGANVSYTHAFSEDYAKRGKTPATSYVVTVKNPGNTTLTVSLNVKRGSDYVYGTKTTATTGILTDANGDGTYDDANGMTFAGLTTSFVLAPNATSDPITVTIPTPLGVAAAKNYAFEFTSEEKDKSPKVYGPGVTYKLTETVTPLEITAIAAVAAGAGETDFDYKADETKLELKNKAKDWTLTGKTDIETQGVDLTTAPEVEYTWWRGPYGATKDEVKDAFDFDKGVFKDGSDYEPADGDNGDGTYSYHDNDQGKAVYIVARPKGIGTDPASNSGNVIKAAFDFPSTVAVPYDMTIQIKENTDPVADANVGNYEMYLVPDGKTPNWGTDLADQGIITGAPAKDGQGSWKVEGLKPGTSYNVFTNAVGSDKTAANRQDSNVDVVLNDFLTGASKVVYYHNVVINNTAAVNTPFTIAAPTTQFIETTDGTTAITATGASGGSLAKPAAAFGGVTVATNNDTAADRWVQKGTVIGLTYVDWDRDYKLEWTGTAGSDTVDGDPSTNATTTATVGGANTTIGTTLTLRTYDMVAHVTGKGTVSEIKLTGPVTATSTSSTGAGNSVAFKLPAGDYELSTSQVSGTDLLGYRAPYDPDDTSDPADKSLTVKAGKTGETGVVTSLEIKVNAAGRIMEVKDNAGTTFPVNSNKDLSGMATFKNGTVSDPADINQVITLPYGYTGGNVTLTVTNKSENDSDILNAVTMATATAFTSPKLQISDAGSSTPVKLDGSESMALNATTTATLTIDSGLAVGEYTGKLTFSFLGEAGNDATKAIVNYNLTVKVVPAEFETVTMTQADGTAVGDMIPYGVDLKASAFTTSDPDLGGLTSSDENFLTLDTDYVYEWYATAADATLSDEWKDGALTTTATKIGTGDTLSKTTIADHPGEKIWLAIVAKNDPNQNVINAAVTGQVTGYRPKVTVREDGTSIPADDAGNFTVKLVAGDGTIIPTVWDTDGFVPVANDGTTQISLAADVEYKVFVNTYEGQSIADGVTTNMKDSGKTVKLGQNATVDYYTVHPVAAKDYEGLTGKGETFDSTNPLPTYTITYGTETVTETMGILAGETVDAKVPTAWSQDYKMTWYTVSTAGDAPVPGATPAVPGAYADTNPTMTKGITQKAAAAVSTGITGVAVSNKTYIGGRLDQNKYTIKATVQADPTTSSAHVTAVAVGDVTNTGNLTHGQSTTFTVVAGDHTVTATKGAGTVIASMQWESETAVADTNTVTGTVDATGDGETYEVIINLVGSSVSFTVTDGTRTATGTPTTYGHDTNDVDRYFHYIDKTHATIDIDGTIVFDLTLGNPGNKTLDMSLDVFRLDSLPADADYADPSSFTDPVYSTSDENAEPALKSADGARTVLTLSDVMAEGADLVKKTGSTNGALDAAKLTLGTGAYSKDSGVYVFRFKGTTDEAGDTSYAYYVLDLSVDQLPIVSVTTQMKTAANASLADGSMPGEGDKLQAEGYDATTNESLKNVMVHVDDANAEKTAADAGLTAADVHFAWVRVDKGVTLATTDLSVVATGDDAGTLASAKGDVVSQSEEYVLVDGDADHDFYLVAYAPNYTGNKVNAKDMQLASVIQAKRTVGVQISLNGVNNILPSGTSTTEPTGYGIYLLEDTKTFDTDKIATTWDGANKRYTAPIDLDKVYHIYARSYQNGARYVDTGLTLGKANPTPTLSAVVNYWNVTSTVDVDVDNQYEGFKSYLPGANDLKNALSVAVSTTRGGTTYETTALNAGTVPVLAGMKVKVTVDAAAQNDAATPKAWSDFQTTHYMNTTGWAKDSDTATSGTNVAYEAEPASGNITVDGIKSFSAVLKQVLVDVEFTVKDVTPNDEKDPSITPSLASATLTPDGAKETGVTASYSIAGTVGNGTGSKQGSDGAKVAFTQVPVGDLIINAVAATKTLYVGATWNDTTGTAKGVKGLSVAVDGTDATDKHAGNTLQILLATNSVQWYDDFNTTDGSRLDEVVESNGFPKTGALGLKAGYTATDSVLTYTVRVQNNGSDNLPGFKITRDAGATADFEVDLSQVRYYGADGTLIQNDANVAAGFDLASQEYVEFEVTIPAGKVAQDAAYEGTFSASCTAGNVGGADYSPAYDVKDELVFTPGKAQVIFGNSAFVPTPDQIVNAWSKNDTTQTKPTLTYEVLALGGTDATADADAATLALINEKLGLTGDAAVTELDAKPTWLTLNNDGTFAVTDKANTVNVESQDPDSYVAVEDEVVLYVKVTDANGKTYVTTFTVDVEPGQLNIVDPVFDPKNPDDATKRPYGGTAVNKGDFIYKKVVDQAGTAIVDEAADPTTAPNTANGNKPGEGNEFSGEVYVGGTHRATWTLDPTKTKYIYDETGAETEYPFTVAYKPDSAEQWNYKPATEKPKIKAEKPPLGLTFRDVLGKSSTEAADAVLSIRRAPDGGYSTILTDNAPLAPTAMDETNNTFRKGESIVYLDTEPSYTVTLKGTGRLTNMTVVEELSGFAVRGDGLRFAADEIFEDGAEKTFVLELSPISGSQWAGRHTAKYTVTGTDVNSGETTSAVYELVFQVEPKPIAEARVTGPDAPTPEGTPDKTITVTAKDPDGEDIKPGTPDKHGNTPITPTVTWTDKDGNEVETFIDGEEYTDTVVLTPDPNYTFEDKTPPADEPNYTKNGKTDENDDPTKVDEDLTITVTPEKDPPEPDRNKEVKFEHKTLLPKKALLKFDDVKTADTGVTTTDVTVPADGSANENYKRTVTVVRGQQLGEYTINLGAYDNTVTDVKLTEVNGLPTEGLVWSLAPATLDHPLDAVNGDPAGAKQSYTLDLRGIDTAKLSTTADYTLVLTAKGCDDYAPDADHPNVTATYTLTVKVLPAPTPVLKFHDVKQDGADTTDVTVPTNGDAAVNYQRTVTVQREKTLGKYVIDLSAFTNLVKGVSVTKTTDTLPNGTAWEATFPDTVGDMNVGDQKTYAVLDLSDVYTVELDTNTTYTVKLTAAGTDLNGENVTATYTLDIKVTPATPSQLMVKDLLKAGTGAGTENVIAPAENVYATTYTRDITVKWDKDSGWWYPLGTYDLDVGASGNAVRDIVLTSDSDLSSASVEALSAVCAGTKLEKLALDKGGTWSFALDLSDVDYTKLNTDETDPAKLPYVTLTATGKDLNGTTVTATYKLTMKFEAPPKPELKFDDVKQGGTTNDAATTGPEVNDTRSVTATEGAKLGKYTIYLGAYNAGVKVTSITSTRSPNLVYDVTPDCTTLTPTLVERKGVDDAQAFELDLTGMETKVGTYTLTLVAQGVDMSGKYTVNASYTLTIKITPKGGGGGGGGGGTSCPSQVTYLLGLYGTTKDSTMEMVSGKSVKSVPNVSALEGYKFLGWSLAGPTGNAEQDAKRTLVDPKSVSINGDTTFYAVYQVLYKVPQPPVHKHYVIGYPNGNFGPADNINRASVATIIARAVLPNFVEGADYGNPGGYSDVDGHWAASAIAYCSKYGVFKGYDDGTFRPDRPISRQELALVMARLSGVKSGSAPFSDISTAGDWAKDGIYTAYANGWVNGYTDGTFKPLNPIRRDETVKIFNAYLGRGVDAEGLSTLTEYVHTGVASNVTENGTTEYMTWPDVTKDQWAYYEIIEAANDHEFEVDTTQPKGYAVPETWTKCWIDEKWRYHDDANDGGPSAVVSALPRKRGAAD